MCVCVCVLLLSLSSKFLSFFFSLSLFLLWCVFFFPLLPAREGDTMAEPRRSARLARLIQESGAGRDASAPSHPLAWGGSAANAGVSSRSPTSAPTRKRGTPLRTRTCTRTALGAAPAAPPFSSSPSSSAAVAHCCSKFFSATLATMSATSAAAGPVISSANEAWACHLQQCSGGEMQEELRPEHFAVAPSASAATEEEARTKTPSPPPVPPLAHTRALGQSAPPTRRSSRASRASRASLQSSTMATVNSEGSVSARPSRGSFSSTRGHKNKAAEDLAVLVPVHREDEEDGANEASAADARCKKHKGLLTAPIAAPPVAAAAAAELLYMLPLLVALGSKEKERTGAVCHPGDSAAGRATTSRAPLGGSLRAKSNFGEG
eukprot:m.245721 g.245721  ORF g.245721 m.245721 type:complete len:378 (+) comp22577_c6_seq2:3-1136(+)